MQEKIRKKTKVLAIVFLGVMIFLVGLFFIQQLVAFVQPAENNYRIERLNPGEAVDAYLYTAENIISLCFMGILLAYLVVALVFIIIKKNSMHLILLLIGQVLFEAYAMARVIFCFSKGSTSIIVGIFYLVSFLAGLYMIYQLLRRGLDGDALTPYYVAAIVCFGLFFFASATKSSYSLLNAYSHIANIVDEVHEGYTVTHPVMDIVYWGGYATSRLYALLFAFIIFGNTHFEFHPEEALTQQEEAPSEPEIQK